MPDDRSDYTFRFAAVELMSEAVGEQIVDLYGRDGLPLAKISHAEAQERRALLDHMAYLLERREYIELGQVFADRVFPAAHAHIDESIKAVNAWRRSEAARKLGEGR